MKNFMKINSELADPTLLFVRSENRPLLEKIIQEHSHQRDEESLKLRERANKLISLIDSLKQQQLDFHNPTLNHLPQ
jgi:hypothetical protein